MTSKEFVIWLKGFTEGVHDFNVTPKQWDIMKDKLEEVSDEPILTGVPTPIGVPYTPQYPPYTDPFNPYKVTCGGTGTTPVRTSGYSQRTDLPVNNPTTLTVTTGSGVGYGVTFTTGDPNVLYSTAYNPVSGSWHYTTSKDKTLLHD